MKNTQVRRENKIKSTHITITKNPRSNISILKIVPHFLSYQTTHTKKWCHLSYITTSTSQKLNLFHYPHHKYPRTQAPNPHNRKFSPIFSATKQPHQLFFKKKAQRLHVDDHHELWVGLVALALLELLCCGLPNHH